MRETKTLRFDLKALQEDGTFEGRLSVYNVVDQGKDLVVPGAFTKTIKDHDGKVPMLWQHKYDSPIGSLYLEDREDALWVKGVLLLEDAIPDARRAYALLKAGIIRGLSIGYDVITKEIKGGVRHLKELKLYEGSVVTFPMNEMATIQSVKSDFATEFERWQTWDARSIAVSALSASLDSILWDDAMEAAEKIAKSDESITQFHEKYLEILPQLLDLLGMKEQLLAEAKAGRAISAATRGKIEAAIKVLQALLDEAGSTSGEAATTPQEAAEAPSEPEADAHHLLVMKSLADMQAAFRAAA
jgi:HK97 family phage prohead protease